MDGEVNKMDLIILIMLSLKKNCDYLVLILVLEFNLIKEEKK